LDKKIIKFTKKQKIDSFIIKLSLYFHSYIFSLIKKLAKLLLAISHLKLFSNSVFGSTFRISYRIPMQTHRENGEATKLSLCPNMKTTMIP
jgi:hypothetical protein